MHRNDIRIFLQLLISRIRKRISASPRRYGYLLPLFIAMSLFLIISFYSAPPVTGKILHPLPEPVSGVIFSFENREFGWVPSEAALYQLFSELPAEHGWFVRSSEYRKRIEFKAGESTDPETDTQTSIQALTEFLAPRTGGYAITVEGEPVAVLSTEENCRAVLNNLTRDFLPETPEGEVITELKVKLTDNPRVVSGIFQKSQVLGEEDAVTLIKKGTLEEKLYTITPGDTVWSISRKHNLTMNDIVQANPGMNPDRIYPGDVLSLIVPKPYLNVVTEYTHIYTRSIPYRTYVSWDPSLYRTESIYRRRGAYGSERIMASVSMQNGMLKERKIIQSKTVTPPVSALLRRGTARTPDDILVASSFLPEGIGIITSYFGPRWGRFHYGIDVNAPLGTPVHAFRAGKVAYAGFNYLLGHLVTLIHEDGTVTRYGHNDSLLVSTGDIVEQGQVLALSGNSGDSTGPHVHFEVRTNGVARDPLKYLKALANSR